MELQNVVLVDGARTAFARGGRGKLVATRLDTAGAKVIRGLLDRNPKVEDTMIEDVGLGNVGGRGEFTMLGVVARLAGLPLEVCSFNSNRQCGSSMETLHRVAMSIMVGASECGIALGIERMGRTLGGGMGGGGKQTRVSGFNKRWFEMNDAQKSMAPDHDEYFSTPIPDYILNAPPLMGMTQTAQNVVEMYDLSRKELDEFSVKSHARAAEATEAGTYKDEIIPLQVEDPVFNDKREWVEEERGEKITFDKDECIRPGTDLETLSGLNPVKGIQSFGDKELRITAGNSCPTNDGVSAALLMSEKKALELGLEPLARIKGIGVGGVKPQVMGLGPVVSTKKALKHAGIEAGDLDRVEFNEAFAAQVLPSLRELGISEDKVNVNGGSIALGHPLGATGARLVLTVAHELRRSKKKYGLGTQCIGAGMGISTIVEALD
ncbi:MAG: thiolase family protein [Myxococcales bacterium]|nr:thiolase family protein [Myxococcales bacterium]